MSGFDLLASDGERLEARWDAPARPKRAVVLCHPHPQHGGTMHAPLLRWVTKVLGEQKAAVLRFNFRGVGTSTGRWGGGEAELSDVAAAVEAARAAYPNLSLGLAGWSFGAATALRWMAHTKEALPYAGIAPASSQLTSDLPHQLPPARRRFILGDRDQFISVENLRPYAESVGAELVVVPGSDHFFYHRERKVGELVAEVLAQGPE
ncbi:MAG: alpha/beta fold hydrolase [Actinomycetota bacterium]|nr:alpha/beta fold hydrolase [Actinomycetota bacterium]